MLKSCVFNKKGETLILHFTTHRLTDREVVNPTTLKAIHYNPVDPNISYEDFVGYLTERLAECDKMSVLIIIDANLARNIPGFCNSFFEGMRDIRLQNVNLINIITSGRFCVYDLPVLRKSLNVGFKGYASYFGDEFNLSGRIQANKAFVRSNGRGNKAVFKIMSSAQPKSSKLTDQWWFASYFSIPPCANFRLTQSTGTCWMNALINSMFLSEPISRMIKNRFIHGAKTVPLRQFGNKGLSLYTLFTSLVYHLLIMKTKATEEDGNFIGYLAAAVKCKYSNQTGSHCESIPYGSGGIPFKAAGISLPGLLNESDFSIFDPLSFLIMTRNADVKHYNYLVSLYNKSVRSWGQKNNIAHLNDELDSIKIKMDQIEKEIQPLAYGTVNLPELMKKPYFGSLPSPKLIVVSIPSRNKYVSSSFKHKGFAYHLESAVIGLYSRETRSYHSIAGFTCENKLFVYDSNNFLAECDWRVGNRGLQSYYNSDPLITKRQFELSSYEIAFYIRE